MTDDLFTDDDVTAAIQALIAQSSRAKFGGWDK